jgi:hypothetical protein
MAQRPRPPPVGEPVVALGARLSWSGLQRPGDPFPFPGRTRRAVISDRFGAPLLRQYAAWASRYRRFVANVSSARVVVDLAASRPTGVQCFVHWVARSAILGTEGGSVCVADGWPPDLWRALLDAAPPAQGRPVAEGLRELLDHERSAEDPLVSAWRELMRGRPVDAAPAELRSGWLPAPVPLDGSADSTAALMSWSPGGPRFDSLTEAVASLEGRRWGLDLSAQARYHAECRLGSLHGIEFGACDRLPDPEFEGTEVFRRVWAELAPVEQIALGDPLRGRLDRLG